MTFKLGSCAGKFGKSLAARWLDHRWTPTLHSRLGPITESQMLQLNGHGDVPIHYYRVSASKAHPQRLQLPKQAPTGLRTSRFSGTPCAS